MFQAYKFKDSSLVGCITQQALCIKFSYLATLFDERISSDKQKRLINSVVCMKLELPVSTFPDAVLLNLAISYKSNVPQSHSFTAKARMGGPADYIHPVTPAPDYAPRAALSVQEAAVLEYVFQSASMPRFVKGRGTPRASSTSWTRSARTQTLHAEHALLWRPLSGLMTQSR